MHPVAGRRDYRAELDIAANHIVPAVFSPNTGAPWWVEVCVTVSEFFSRVEVVFILTVGFG